MLQNKRVLIVDDEPDLREILTDELIFAGANVETAKNGIEGFQKASQNSYDIIVSDVRMPGGDGASMVRKIRSQISHPIVIAMMSGFSDVEFDEIYDFGADVYLSKPFSLSLVLENLERQLKPLEQRYQSSADSSAKKKIQYSVSGIEEAIKKGLASLGRGGVFLKTDEHHLRLGDVVEFRLGDFHGQGIIRWVRSVGDINGIGVDFTWLNPSSLMSFQSWIKNNFTWSYIPMK